MRDPRQSLQLFFVPEICLLFKENVFSWKSKSFFVCFLVHYFRFFFLPGYTTLPRSFETKLHNSNLSISKTNIYRNFVWKICLTERLVRINVTLIPVRMAYQQCGLNIVGVRACACVFVWRNCSCLQQIWYTRKLQSYPEDISVRFACIAFYQKSHWHSQMIWNWTFFFSFFFSISFSLCFLSLFLFHTHFLHHHILFADITKNSPLN